MNLHRISMTLEELELELQARRSYLPLRIEITVDVRDRSRAPDVCVREVLHSLHYRLSSTQNPMDRSGTYIATQEQPTAHLLQASRDWCYSDLGRSASLHALYRRMGLPRMEAQMAYDVFTPFLTIEDMQRASTEDAHYSPPPIQIEDSFPRSWCIGGYRFLEKRRLADLSTGFFNTRLGTPFTFHDETDHAVAARQREMNDAAVAQRLAASAAATEISMNAAFSARRMLQGFLPNRSSADLQTFIMERIQNLTGIPTTMAMEIPAPPVAPPPPKPSLADALLQRGRRLTLPAPPPRETGA